MVRRNDQYIGGGYFSAGDLAALRLYKYRSIDLSPVSKVGGCWDSAKTVTG